MGSSPLLRPGLNMLASSPGDHQRCHVQMKVIWMNYDILPGLGIGIEILRGYVTNIYKYYL